MDIAFGPHNLDRRLDSACVHLLLAHFILSCRHIHAFRDSNLHGWVMVVLFFLHAMAAGKRAGSVGEFSVVSVSQETMQESGCRRWGCKISLNPENVEKAFFPQTSSQEFRKVHSREHRSIYHHRPRAKSSSGSPGLR